MNRAAVLQSGDAAALIFNKEDHRWNVTHGKEGICHYSIWMTGDELFGYYECEKGIDYAAKVQAESEVVKRWDESMKGILIMEKDPVTGAQPLLEQVFWLE